MSKIFCLGPIFYPMINPIDLNLAIFAHAVFPPNNHIHQKKIIFPHFSKENPKKILTAYRGPIYENKAHEMFFKGKRNDFVLINW